MCGGERITKRKRVPSAFWALEMLCTHNGEHMLGFELVQRFLRRKLAIAGIAGAIRQKKRQPQCFPQCALSSSIVCRKCREERSLLHSFRNLSFTKGFYAVNVAHSLMAMVRECGS